MPAKCSQVRLRPLLARRSDGRGSHRDEGAFQKGSPACPCAAGLEKTQETCRSVNLGRAENILILFPGGRSNRLPYKRHFAYCQ